MSPAPIIDGISLSNKTNFLEQLRSQHKLNEDSNGNKYHITSLHHLKKRKRRKQSIKSVRTYLPLKPAWKRKYVNDKKLCILHTMRVVLVVRGGFFVCFWWGFFVHLVGVFLGFFK